jgi:ClpP class serine protease
MDWSSLLWLFFIFAALQPMVRQRYQVLKRANKIAEIQTKRGSRVITLVHRQETMRLLGFPVVRYIDMDDSEAVVRAIHEMEDNAPIDIMLHTPGGLVLASLQIARALREHKAKVTVFVPHMAMSGGTLIALAADEIVMCSHSMLGPIDPQIGTFPAASLIKVVKDKPIAEIDDQTLILADVGAKAMEQVCRAATELLEKRMPHDKARALAEKLSSGQWTHDYPITVTEAREMGLNVTTDMPEEVFELMALYPQPVRTNPTVEYLPVPPAQPPQPARRPA